VIEIKVASVPGDGIGPEVVAAGQRVLSAVGNLYDVRFVFENIDAGAGLYRRDGTAYHESDFKLCQDADAVLVGALGLPDVCLPDGTEAGGQLNFRLRFGLELFAGVRPTRRLRNVMGPLASDRPFDFTIIRENTEGLYASRGGGSVVADRVVTDTMIVSDVGVDRVVRFAFDWAMRHPPLTGTPRVTCVDKANVLRSYAFFRNRFGRVAQEYAGQVESESRYVDSFCADLVLTPWLFHVCVAENMFGDITSDLAGSLSGSLGLSPSADIGSNHGVFQSAHGSAPTLTSKGVANPVATILSVAMLVEWLSEKWDSAVLREMAGDLVQAVPRALDEPGARTPDIGGRGTTQGCTQAVIDSLIGPREEISRSASAQ